MFRWTQLTGARTFVENPIILLLLLLLLLETLQILPIFQAIHSDSKV